MAQSYTDVPATLLRLIDGIREALSPEERLYLDRSGNAILLWRDDEAPLRRGEYPAVVGIHLTGRHLVAVSARELSSFTAFADVTKTALLQAATSALATYRHEGSRYHGALDPHLSSPDAKFIVTSTSLSPPVLWRELSGLSSLPEWDNTPAARLDEIDIRLINLWSGNPPEHQLTLADLRDDKAGNARRNRRYIHARMAEKFVANYYNNQLRRPASDVSVLQLQPSQSDWLTHDLQADVSIDVKNATVFGHHRRHNYVERFKRTGGRDVRIAGVLTMYPRTPTSGARQTFLGLVSQADVERALSATNGLPKRAVPVQLSFDSGYIPPWAFEIETARVRYEGAWEWMNLLARKPETRIAIAIATGRHRDSPVYRGMNRLQRAFVDRFTHVIDHASYRKLSIALFAISEFLAALALGRDASIVIHFLRRIISVERIAGTSIRMAGLGSGLSLFNARRETYNVAMDQPASPVGGLHDPTGSIEQLLDLLAECGASIARAGLQFSHFDAPSPYILLGRTTMGRKVTVYAYCGGTNQHGNRCDRFPLVIGRHRTCECCGKLICDDCDFCTEDCERTRQPAPDEPW